MSKHEELAIISKELMLEQPFYGLFLIGLNKEFGKAVPTAGVSRQNINYKKLTFLNESSICPSTDNLNERRMPLYK